MQSRIFVIVLSSPSRGQLHYLLTNPTYRGLIRPKAQRKPRLHAAVVGDATWERVQVLP